MAKILAFFFPLFFLCSWSFAQKDINEVPLLILVSIDGYRYDYTNLYHPPNISRLKEMGSFSEKMNPAYPSKTFPNHYTLATGLYPGEHGIVDNIFYDAKRKENYKVGDRSKVEDGSWYSGEPIWNTAQKNGYKAASFFWVGSEAKINNSYPNYYFKYDAKVPYEKRVQQVFDWIKLPKDEQPRLILLYFENVDEAGHNFSPDSKEVEMAVHKVDSAIGMLMNGLEKINVPYNLVLTADHGMLAFNTKKNALSFDSLMKDVDFPFLNIQNNNFQVHINPVFKKDTKAIYKALKSKENGKFDVYLRKNTPKHWFYDKNKRVGEILVVAKSPYFFSPPKVPEKNELRGNHGPDPDNVPEMRTILYAYGANIQSGIVLDKFQNVALYPFLCDLLDIPIKRKFRKRYGILKSLIRKK